MLMKVFKEYTNRWKDLPYSFLDWKNHYCQNDYTTQDNLQIKCYPCQINNGIFHRTRTNKS